MTLSLPSGLDTIGEGLLEPVRRQFKHEFEGLEAFAFQLVAMSVLWREERKQALKAVGNLLTRDMRAQIGAYQPQVGNYLEWAPLADSTEDEKARLGAPADAPLERWGDLAKSFRSTVEGSEELIAGSTDPVMEYHEFGTDKMSPRSVVGPALYKNIEAIRKLIGYSAADTIVSGQRLGYRFDAEAGGIAQPEETIG